MYLATLSLALQTFTYTIHDIPSFPNQECEEVAYQLSHRFEKSFDVKTTDSMCDWEDPDIRPKNTWTIKLSYESEIRLNKVSTLSLGAFNTETYKNAQNCREALTNELKIFKNETGLEPFVYYCKPPLFQDSFFPESLGYTLVIESFGNPTKKPSTASAFLREIPNNLEEVTTYLDDLFKSKNAVTSQITTKSDVGIVVLIVRYYSDMDVKLRYDDLGRFSAHNECESQKQKIITLKNQQILPFCGKTSLGILREETNNIRISKLPAKYHSLINCNVELQEQIEKYRNLGKNVIGGLCSMIDIDPEYQMIILEKK